MKKLSDYTSTELFLLAHGLELPDHPTAYKELCEMARQHNYSSCIEFAEDMRFKKLVQIYREKKLLQLQMIEQRESIEINEQMHFTTIDGGLNYDHQSEMSQKEMNNNKSNTRPPSSPNHQEVFKSESTLKSDTPCKYKNILEHSDVQNHHAPTEIKPDTGFNTYDSVSVKKRQSTQENTTYNDTIDVFENNHHIPESVQTFDKEQSHNKTYNGPQSVVKIDDKGTNTNKPKDTTTTDTKPPSDTRPITRFDHKPFHNKNELTTVELFTLKRMVESNRPVKRPNTQFSFKIKPDTHFNKPQALPQNQNKQTKVFYKQMTDDEKEIDDFLDKLQERNNEKIRSKNISRNVEIMNKNESNAFQFICEKIMNKKGVKDKELWPAEFKIIIEKIKLCYSFDFEPKVDMTLIQAVLPVLMKLQQFILEKNKLDMAVFLKKMVMAFYDYYKK